MRPTATSEGHTPDSFDFPIMMVYPRGYADGWEAEESLGRYFQFYCEERIHQSLDYRTPAEVYGRKAGKKSPANLKRGGSGRRKT